MNVIVSPGSNKVVANAADLFGTARVVAGGFREPVHINSLNQEELDMAVEFFQEMGHKVTIGA